MNLIILASGTSSRFKRAGYQLSKYQLPFLGKSILDHLVSAKGAKSIRIVHNKNDMQSKDMQLLYQKVCRNQKTLTSIIDNHKLGPVQSLQEIIHEIELDEPYAISYCDYFASALLSEDALCLPDGADGSVLIYHGFHPHHVFHTSVYGYLRLNQEGIAVDYKEKSYFTDNKVEEPCSAGLYVFRNGRILKEAMEHLHSNSVDYKVNGELYVSMLMKSMIDRGLTVKTHGTCFFAQLGTPEDYEDHVHWSSNALTLCDPIKSFNFAPRSSGTCLVLMSGEGKRFSAENYRAHKALLDVQGKSILQHIIEALPKFKHYAFTVSESRQDLADEIIKICNSLDIEAIILPIVTPNEGQAHSAMQALEALELNGLAKNEPIYIAPCDSILRFSDTNLSFLDSGRNGVVVAATNPFARLKPTSYSYAKIQDSLAEENIPVQEISVKEKPVEGQCFYLTGAFYGSSLESLSKKLKSSYYGLELVNGEKYLDTFFQELAQDQDSLMATIVSTYHSLGTPLEYETSIYWNSFVSEMLDSIDK